MVLPIPLCDALVRLFLYLWEETEGLFIGQLHHDTRIIYYVSIWMDNAADDTYISDHSLQEYVEAVRCYSS